MVNFRSSAKRVGTLSLGSIFLTSIALAAPTVATVTSAVPFVIDGHSVSSPGLTSFPVVAGDTVATSNGPAVLLFHDGSTVKLSDNSSVKLDSDGANPKVVLVSGSLDYKLASGSNVKVTNLDAASPVQNSEAMTSSADSSRGRFASVVHNPAFIISTGSGVGVASGLLSSFAGSGSTAASAASTSTSGSPMIAHCPPISIHL